jgi:hypothetical protein
MILELETIVSPIPRGMNHPIFPNGAIYAHFIRLQNILYDIEAVGTASSGARNARMGVWGTGTHKSLNGNSFAMPPSTMNTATAKLTMRLDMYNQPKHK